MQGHGGRSLDATWDLQSSLDGQRTSYAQLCQRCTLVNYCAPLQDYQYDEKNKLWFKLFTEKSDWYKAKYTCEQDGALLASPIDKGLVKVFRTIANEHGVVRTFVGVHPGHWQSVEGIPFSTLQENIFGFNVEQSIPCAVLNYGHLLSAECSEKNAFVCYKRDTQAIQSAACETAKTGYEWSEETGHCYKFHNAADTWWRALGICLKENAYLTIINSQQEANVIRQIFQQKKSTSINSDDSEYAHVGFIDWEHNRNWYTVDGEPLHKSGYVGWKDGEPDGGYGNSEHCGSIYNNGRLNDIRCKQKAVFICEKDI